jgi:SH3-like domain-containing protein
MKMSIRHVLGRHVLSVVCLLAALAAGPALAQNANTPAKTAANTSPDEAAPRIGPISGLALPRYVALRASKVNLRTGPGLRYPIDWVYQRSGLPVEIIDEFETWRRIRDWEGSIGWVHQNMLTGDRRALVVGKQRLLRREPEDRSVGLALLEPGVIGRLSSCAGGWCEITVKGIEGWLREDEIYGVAPDEVVR